MYYIQIYWERKEKKTKSQEQSKQMYHHQLIFVGRKKNVHQFLFIHTNLCVTLKDLRFNPLAYTRSNLYFH